MNPFFCSETHSTDQPTRRSSFRTGFALVVTVSILVLLAVVSVGLLTLSTVAVRSGSLVSAQAEARANARLALIIAVGELQKQIGPDQRVTASAAILDSSPDSSGVDGVVHPYWTGCWESWGAGEEKFGNDELSDHRTVRNSRIRGGNTAAGMNPSYEEGREDHFRSWLVSLSEEQRVDLATAKGFALDGASRPAGDSAGVRLVGEGSIGEPNEEKYVAAPLQEVETGRRGRYAWWVGDESAKARVLVDAWEDGEDELTIAERLSRTQSAGSPGLQALEELESLDDPERLKNILSRRSLELAVTDGAGETRRLFHDVTPWSMGVLADVREGGLKRDLSAILERQISTRRPMTRTLAEDNLYGFDRQNQQRVPIQDLAAYYQCYREVVDYTGTASRNPSSRGALQVNNIDFGKKVRDVDLGTRYNFTRDYTNIYRTPVPVKIQFMLSYVAEPRTAAERRLQPENRDDYKLHIGMTPSFTMWNPFTVPIAMNHGTPQATQLRFFNIPFGLSWTKNGIQVTDREDQNDLVWITNRNMEGWRKQNGVWVFNEARDRDNGLTLYVGGERPIIFQPGEVRVFSLRAGQLRGSNELLNSNVWRRQLESHPGWDPNSALILPRSEKRSLKRHVQIEHPGATESADGRRSGGGSLTFKRGDSITLRIDPTGSREMANGAAMHFFIRQGQTMTGGQEQGDDRAHMRREYQLTSRLHSWNQTAPGRNEFNEKLMESMFPGKGEELVLDVPVNNLAVGEGRQAFLLVSMTAACEVSENTAGAFQGRRFPARPFLHSSPVQSVAFIDRVDADASYQHGWNWWVEPINSEDEVGGVAANNWNSFYGGGYNADFGTSFCIQQEVPLAPVHSIAALSHSQLSGYSLADRILGRSAGARNEKSVSGYVDNPFANMTATGGNGLFPRTTQAIGNSYAHPHLAPDEAYSRWSRHFNATNGVKPVYFVDHSYLANKALWDEYFFSSITSHQPSRMTNRTKIWDDGVTRSAQELAENFFFEGGDLPNPRLAPYSADLSEEKLSGWFQRDEISLDGAEEMAAHLLVKGPFNVNSTSEAAWRALFSSGRNAAVQIHVTPENTANGRLARWPRAMEVKESGGSGTEGETNVSGFAVTSGEPWSGSASDPADPEQWNSWRALTDEQIEELAAAMVEQVKERGPFLSLSEFVNRRLDDQNKELSVKGALQAALDDEDVSINEGFRDGDRSYESVPDGMGDVKFPEAMLGPIAYGSSAYVDQADLLRNFGAQLTPRGDSFVVRAYGDALDGEGKVLARAWCEAVVQRVPDYLDAGEGDEPQEKPSELESEANKVFGRSLRIVSFRWLDQRDV